MFFRPAELARETRKLRSIAREHRMAVALSNYGGPTGDLPACGRSAIWAPGGEPVVRLPEGGEGLAVAAGTGRELRGWIPAATFRSA